MILQVSKTTFTLCEGVIPRKIRIVRIGGIEFRQYFEISTGLYLLELMVDPAKNSGWLKREYQTMNWGRELVMSVGKP